MKNKNELVWGVVCCVLWTSIIIFWFYGGLYMINVLSEIPNEEFDIKNLFFGLLFIAGWGYGLWGLFLPLIVGLYKDTAKVYKKIK